VKMIEDAREGMEAVRRTPWSSMMVVVVSRSRYSLTSCFTFAFCHS
jgi:hypothetical protein